MKARTNKPPRAKTSLTIMALILTGLELFLSQFSSYSLLQIFITLGVAPCNKPRRITGKFDFFLHNYSGIAGQQFFLRYSVRYDGIPFDLRIEQPNAETLAAI
ncbi:MAG: hypothetical protein AAGU32_08085, partial [Bacillota bacterium]